MDSWKTILDCTPLRMYGCDIVLNQDMYSGTYADGLEETVKPITKY